MPRLIGAGQPRTRRGMTLAELLIALVMLGVVGTVLSRMMLGQQRLYHYQTEQMGVRRELRTALSLLPADLRSLSSSGGDLTDFSATTIQFRNVLGASIVCAKPNNTTMDLPPLNMAKNILTSWYTKPVVGDSVYAFNEGLLRGAEDDSWTGFRITSVTENAAYCPASVYTDAALDNGKVRYRLTVSPAIPDSVKIGAGVRFVRHTRYALEQASSTKWYLSRAEYLGGTWTASTMVSGPYDAPAASGSSGIRFAFFDSLGAVVNSVANSRSVARVDLLLKARGAASSGKVYAGRVDTENRDSLAFRVALRNRQ